MTREEHTEKIRTIQERIKDFDDGTLTEELANISVDYGETLGVIDALTQENIKLKADNENLRDTNMRLFLKVGEEVIEDKKEENEDSEDNDETPEDFEELFDEKGEL